MELLSTIAMIVATSSAALLSPLQSLSHSPLLSSQFPSDFLSCTLGTTGIEESTMPYLKARWRMAFPFPFRPPDCLKHISATAAAVAAASTAAAPYKVHG